MKTLLIIVAVLIGLYLIGSQSPGDASAPPEPAGKVEIVGVSCDTNSYETRAKGTIRNAGGVAIKFPEVFVRFSDGTVGSGIAQPMTLEPGSFATFDVKGPRAPNSVTCQVYGVQNAKGLSVL